MGSWQDPASLCPGSYSPPLTSQLSGDAQGCWYQALYPHLHQSPGAAQGPQGTLLLWTHPHLALWMKMSPHPKSIFPSLTFLHGSHPHMKFSTSSSWICPLSASCILNISSRWAGVSLP